MSKVILRNKNCIVYYFDNKSDYESHDVSKFDQFSWEGDDSTPHILFVNTRRINNVQTAYNIQLTIEGKHESYGMLTQQLEVDIPKSLHDEMVNIGVSLISFIQYIYVINSRVGSDKLGFFNKAVEVDYVLNDLASLLLDNSGKEFYFTVLLMYADSVLDYIVTNYNSIESDTEHQADFIPKTFVTNVVGRPIDFMITNVITKSCGVILCKLNDIIDSYSNAIYGFVEKKYSSDNATIVDSLIKKLAEAVIDINFYCSEDRWITVQSLDRKIFMRLFKNSSRDVVFNNYIDKYPAIQSMTVNTASELICSDCKIINPEIMAGMMYNAFTKSSVVYLTKEKEFRVVLNLSYYMIINNSDICNDIHESDFTDELNKYLRYGFVHAILYHSYNFNPKLRQVLNYNLIEQDMIDISWTESRGKVVARCKFDVEQLGVFFTKERVDLL